MPRPQQIRRLKDILVLAKKIAGSKTAGNNRLALAGADQEEGLKCIQMARRHGFVKPVLIGDRQRIARLCRSLGVPAAGMEIIHEPDLKQAAVTAVKMCREGQADILMKGTVSTEVILRAILDRDNGLGRGGLLSNISIFDSPTQNRVLLMTDAAVNISPDLARKVELVRNAIWVAQRLGFVRPKVAVLTAIEKVNPKDMPATADAAVIAHMGELGQIPGADVAGPYALDIAVSKKAAEVKHVTGPVAGCADILLCPDIHSANIFYKSLVYFAGREIANAMIGVKTPLVMTSRADSSLTKLYTMALSVVLAGGDRQ